MPKQIVGVCGCYDVKTHFEYERQRGVHYASTMGRSMGGAENFEKLSPSSIAESTCLKGELGLPPFCPSFECNSGCLFQLYYVYAIKDPALFA